MKSVPLTLAFIALLAFTTVLNAQAQSGEQAVRRVVADFAQAVNRGDAKAFSALFAEDADFVVITGKYLDGRNEIVTYHAGLFTNDFQGSHLEVTSVAIRFLRTSYDLSVSQPSMESKSRYDEGKGNFSGVRVAKDGGDLPPTQAVMREAQGLTMAGETYDFEYQPIEAGDLQLEVSNGRVNKVVQQIEVQ